MGGQRCISAADGHCSHQSSIRPMHAQPLLCIVGPTIRTSFEFLQNRICFHVKLPACHGPCREGYAAAARALVAAGAPIEAPDKYEQVKHWTEQFTVCAVHVAAFTLLLLCWLLPPCVHGSCAGKQGIDAGQAYLMFVIV